MQSRLMRKNKSKSLQYLPNRQKMIEVSNKTALQLLKSVRNSLLYPQGVCPKANQGESA